MARRQPTAESAQPGAGEAPRVESELDARDHESVDGPSAAELGRPGGVGSARRRNGPRSPRLASALAGLPLPLVFLARSARAGVLLGGVLLIVMTERLLRRRYPRFGPTILRGQLENAGAGFAKIGQLLAHRHDVLPDRYCAELSSILDDLPPVPTPLIRRVVESELRVASVGELFSWFANEPLSAASIAQVHSARLLDGTSVVVKVMRPGVEKRFRVDLWLADALARVLSFSRAIRRMGVRALGVELRQLTLEELDFTHEARNFRQLRQRMRSDDIDHYCPQVYPDLCGPRVITMEAISGVSVKELMHTSRVARGVAGSDPSQRGSAVKALATWAAQGITPERTARLMVRSFLEQAMRHRLFHADPHAANLIVMEGGTLAWIDLGMVGWLDERLWAHEFKLREAIAEGRLDAAYGHLLASLEPLPTGDLTSFEAEFKRILHDWLAEIEQPSGAPGSLGMARRSNFHLFVQTLGAVRRAGLRLPAPLVRLYRTIIIGDMVVLQLDPSVDWQALIRDFVHDQRLRQTVELVEKGLSAPNVRAMLELAIEGPTALVEAMEAARERPRPDRARARRVTHTERALRMVVGQVKVAVATATLVLFGASWLPSSWIPGAVAPGLESVRPFNWLILVGGILLAWMLGRVQEELED